MRWIITLILFLLLLALDATLAPRVAVWGAKPDLLIVLIVQIAFQLPRPDDMAWPWIVGLGIDLHEDGPVGVLAFTFGVIGLAIDRLREGFSSDSLVVRLVAVAAAGFVRSLAVMISEMVRGTSFPFFSFWGHAFLSVLYTTLLALALLPLLERVLGRFAAGKQRD